MPRSLPWARETAADTAAKRKAPAPSTAPPPRRPRRRPSPSSDATVEYMLPTDEPYIMVEDELFTTAQLYTRSIHRAEYERLQAEAARKHAGRISAIHRPMDGVTRMSREAVMKHRAMTKAAPADSSDEGEGWGGGGNLAKMMMGKGGEESSSKLAVRWKRTRVATRAAAGFTESQVADRRRVRAKREKEAAVESQYKPEKRKPAILKKEATPPMMASETDDGGDDDDGDDADDDLDAPVIRDISRRPINPQPRTTTAAAPSAPSTAAIPQPPAPRHPPKNPISISPVLTTAHTEPPPSYLPAQATETSLFPGLDTFSIPKPTSTYRGRSMAARRNAEREKNQPDESRA